MATAEIETPLRRLVGNLGAPDACVQIEAGIQMPPGSLGILTGKVRPEELSRRPDILFTPRESFTDRED